MKERRCHLKHLKRGEWKGPINNANTSNGEKKEKKTVTTDAQHNIRFRKLILGVIEKAANSLCTAPTLKSSQLVPAPMAPLCYRLVFTSLLRQPHKRENILCCPTIVALAAMALPASGSVLMEEQRRHMSLARIIPTPIKAFSISHQAAFRLKPSQVSLGDRTLERREGDQKQGFITTRRGYNRAIWKVAIVCYRVWLLGI